MFEWKIEDSKLYLERGRNNRNPFFAFEAERKTSREDKIAFIDCVTDGALSYVLELAKKLESDSPKMRKDKWGRIYSNVLSAWLKKHDTMKICSIISPHVGDIDTKDWKGCKYQLLNRPIEAMNKKETYSLGMYDDYVDSMFHIVLDALCKEEEKYYVDNLDYNTLVQEAVEVIRKYGTLGADLYVTSDEISVYEDASHKAKRALTKDELNAINRQGFLIKKHIESGGFDLYPAITYDTHTHLI